MARAGDEEGKGQKAQKGGRRLILRSRLPISQTRPNILPFLSTAYPILRMHAIRCSTFRRTRAHPSSLMLFSYIYRVVRSIIQVKYIAHVISSFFSSIDPQVRLRSDPHGVF
jgi:hypothetical protein